MTISTSVRPRTKCLTANESGSNDHRQRKDPTKCALWDKDEVNVENQRVRVASFMGLLLSADTAQIIAARDAAQAEVRAAAQAEGIDLEDADLAVDMPALAPRAGRAHPNAMRAMMAMGDHGAGGIYPLDRVLHQHMEGGLLPVPGPGLFDIGGALGRDPMALLRQQRPPAIPGPPGRHNYLQAHFAAHRALLLQRGLAPPVALGRADEEGALVDGVPAMRQQLMGPRPQSPKRARAAVLQPMPRFGLNELVQQARRQPDGR